MDLANYAKNLSRNQLLRINLTTNEITKEIKVKILMDIANYAKNLSEILLCEYKNNKKNYQEIRYE